MKYPGIETYIYQLLLRKHFLKLEMQSVDIALHLYLSYLELWETKRSKILIYVLILNN